MGTIGLTMSTEEFLETTSISNNYSTIYCPFCGADINIELGYQGQIFCWQCGKEI